MSGRASEVSKGWLIGTMCAVAGLTLVALAVCFVRRNKGGKYAGTPPPPPLPQQQLHRLDSSQGQSQSVRRSARPSVCVAPPPTHPPPPPRTPLHDSE